MEHVKTAISLPRRSLSKSRRWRTMHIPRSRLFVLAVEEFIRRHENRRLLERIDAAYADTPDAAEQALHRRMRHQHRHIVEGEW